MTTPLDSTTAVQPVGQRHSVWRQLLGDRRFLAVAVLLAIAAAGLNASVQFLKLHFRKEPVPMRQEFAKAMPEIIGNWVQVARDETLDHDFLVALATDQFLFCSYVDAAAFGQTPQAMRKQLVEGKTLMAQREELGRLMMNKPAAVVQLGLTYYTGKADTVAHVPERCYAGGGYDPVNPGEEPWGLGRELWVRTIGFESQASRQGVSVAYVFHANGHYEPNSLKVRAALQDLFQRHGYYAKIELSCNTRDSGAATASMKRLLEQALPSIEQALPDWEQYRSKK